MCSSLSPFASRVATDFTRSPSLSMLEQTGHGAGFLDFSPPEIFAVPTEDRFAPDACASCFFVHLNRKESPKQRRMTPVIINTNSIIVFEFAPKRGSVDRALGLAHLTETHTNRTDIEVPTGENPFPSFAVP
jgi:hypothetical protein